MYSRSTLIWVLCFILVVVRGTGTHAHLLHEEAGGLPSSAAAMVTTVSDDDADHVAAHLHHGDVDVDSPAKQTSEFPSLDLPVAILAIVCGLLLCLLRFVAVVSRPPLRPPARQLCRYFTPLSHAPPAII